MKSVPYQGLLFLPKDVAIPQSVLHKRIAYKGKELVACAHNWKNVEALIRNGIRAPAPGGIENWKYPGRYTPMKHQRATAKFLVDNPRSFVLSDMRTGKTASAIWAIEYLMQQGVVKRVLIACPLSVLQVWVDEIFNLVPHRTGVVLYGSKPKRLSLLSDNTEYCIINHDGLTTIPDELIKANFDIIVADEASVYRNINVRYRTFHKVIKNIPRIWMMTGTPTPNEPTDAFGLIKLVTPESFVGGKGAFKELVMRKVSMFRWIPRKDALQTVYKYLQPAIRFSIDECVDLPPLGYVNRMCELTTDQVKAYNQMRKQMIMERAGASSITAANAAVLLLKLVQIACGVVKDNDANPECLDAKNRLALLEECILESGRKAIIFVPFIAVQEKIMEYLKAGGFDCELVNGSVGKHARDEIFNRFQNGNLEILVAHPRVAQFGLDLSASHTIIWYGPIFSPEQWTQANARISGPKQKHACTIIKIGATPLEWKLYNALDGKVNLQAMLLKSYQEEIT